MKIKLTLRQLAVINIALLTITILMLITKCYLIRTNGFKQIEKEMQFDDMNLREKRFSNDNGYSLEMRGGHIVKDNAYHLNVKSLRNLKTEKDFIHNDFVDFLEMVCHE